ncbi:hypothetical protein [Marinicella meishanensis]|uniref:hypothetical protein n=1 Tax=Marinicella meishanensis TaxID=2873263 RepID=UPI001CC0B90D|nr:hypothetical protein [Marinicella sp. NBU2979]
MTAHNVAMEVLFIYGPAAAGKYTIGQQVSEAMGWPLFHNHLVVDAVKSLFDFGGPGFIQLRAQMWLEAFSVAAEHNRSFIFTFNPENTVDPALLTAMVARITEQGGQVHFIELRCDEGPLLARMGAPSRQQFGKLTDSDLYQQLKAEGCFEFPRFCDPDLVLDTGVFSAQQSAHLIMEWYRNRKPQ